MKKYAVQYAYDIGIHTSCISASNIKIVTDTNPITYEEAISIFNSHLDDFSYRLKEEQRPQLCIWEDVGDGEYPIYGTALVDLDWRNNLKYKNGKFYKIVEEEVKIPD